MKLIIGLGNPGEKYNGTRHNLGFEVVEELGKKFMVHSSWLVDKKFKSEIIKVNDLLLAKPQTYMNNSGMAVKLMADYYKISVEDIIIIHDDLDISLGKIKIRRGGAAAGHHGVESIINTLGDDKFVRVRLGIGEMHIRDVENFVLEKFASSEKPKVRQMLKHATEAVEILLEKGLEVAQNQYN